MILTHISTHVSPGWGPGETCGNVREDQCQQTEGARKAIAISLDLHRKMGSWDITGKQINGVSVSLEPW